jgi:hypothetical protein
MSKSKPGYVGRYTVNEFALTEQRCLAEHGDEYSRETLHQIANYVARHDWPSQRGETYLASVEQIDENSRAAAVGILRVYDKVQEYFDAVHHGEGYTRVWPGSYVIGGKTFNLDAVLNPPPVLEDFGRYVVTVSGPGITADTEICFSDVL